MKGLNFIPSGTKIPFIGFRYISLVISLVMLVGSLGLFLTQGLNYGIDFLGGTTIEIKTLDGPADLVNLRNTVGSLGLGDVQLQTFGAPNEVLIKVQAQAGGDGTQQQVVTKIKAALDALGGEIEYRSTEVVGPTVSGELVQDSVIAVMLAIGAVLIYIWIRFEWQFSVAAVVALVHDVFITIGFFSLLQLDFNISIIAALLTIVGYSLNDTVVVFDRVREYLRKFKKLGLAELLDQSINSTLSRTILTSVTTLLALLSLYIFGGEVIKGLSLAMIWGVLIGTYSSVFVASPILLVLGVKRDWSKNKTAAETFNK
ncbi:MAG: protein translocase subunit SecF [Rhizobiales bacterium]|nr:protein translocase subunit SecF [Hyphomicrobiales bacterium]NRB12828.1 protein translocase subunit SecF [Hyphomicrobiales bacterium]